MDNPAPCERSRRAAIEHGTQYQPVRAGSTRERAERSGTDNSLDEERNTVGGATMKTDRARGSRDNRALCTKARVYPPKSCGQTKREGDESSSILDVPHYRAESKGQTSASAQIERARKSGFLAPSISNQGANVAADRTAKNNRNQ